MKKIHIISLLTIISLMFGHFSRAELNPLLESTPKYNKVVVERVLRVDTLLLAGGEKVCLIGLQGPRPPKFHDVNRDSHGFIIPDDDPTTSFEVEALRFIKELTEKKTVHLEFDAERRNDDGILQAYVILPDGKMLNEEALRYGYAQLKLRMPNMKYAQRLRDAYKESRREMRGLQGNW
ncbi:MAG: thermonuclease family protein [Candidatus Omnitrophica bacterium]|nr:thermonuclease family protein [Candidatus Omnitrophota bacterium]